MSSEVISLAQDLCQGSRLALAKAITLVESTRPEHRIQAEQLFSNLPCHSKDSIRIAISGPPGVGKSSFIEAFGLHVIQQGKRIAVLAIDPSSPVTGGSILGDKTRMEELAKSEKCFIRPSPSSGFLGGVARHTRESILLCEAAGFDVIIIETVGIGQSEVLAASMSDIFIQLHQPASGDELQGIKKGVMELADLVVVTKADGSSENAAKLAKVELERALSLTRMDHLAVPTVILSSIVLKSGYDLVWKSVCEYQTKAVENGTFQNKRISQNRDWLKQEMVFELQEFLAQHPNYKSELNQLTQNLSNNLSHCASMARSLVNKLLTYK